jgi:hypothetical protein
MDNQNQGNKRESYVQSGQPNTEQNKQQNNPEQNKQPHNVSGQQNQPQTNQQFDQQKNQQNDPQKKPVQNFDPLKKTGQDQEHEKHEKTGTR